MLTQITNGIILVDGNYWIKGGSLFFRDGKIESLSPESTPRPDAERIIDAAGGYVLPGGIDMHVHGGGGRDFMEADREAFLEAIAAHRRFGTTGIVPTLASSTYEQMWKAAQVCTELMADPATGVLGLHLEGPYFNPKMAGGQIPENIRLPEPREYEAFLEAFPCIKRWDMAPELPGSRAFQEALAAKGVAAGLAHTEATLKDLGLCTIATHLYNGMTSVHKEGIYRREGTVESVLLSDNISAELIADGIHVPPVLMRYVHKVKGPERLFFVTDACACAASDSKVAFDPRVIIEDGVAVLSDHSAIAGSVATMDRLIRTAVTDAGLPLEDVSRMVSETPARLLGVFDRKGSLSVGKDADIIIMTPDLRLTGVIAMGRECEIDG